MSRESLPQPTKTTEAPGNNPQLQTRRQFIFESAATVLTGLLGLSKQAQADPRKDRFSINCKIGSERKEVGGGRCQEWICKIRDRVRKASTAYQRKTDIDDSKKCSKKEDEIVHLSGNYMPQYQLVKGLISLKDYWELLKANCNSIKDVVKVAGKLIPYVEEKGHYIKGVGEVLKSGGNCVEISRIVSKLLNNINPRHEARVMGYNRDQHAVCIFKDRHGNFNSIDYDNHRTSVRHAKSASQQFEVRQDQSDPCEIIRYYKNKVGKPINLYIYLDSRSMEWNHSQIAAIAVGQSSKSYTGNPRDYFPKQISRRGKTAKIDDFKKVVIYFEADDKSIYVKGK